MQKNLEKIRLSVLLASCWSTMKIAGAGSGSISQRHRYEGPDPYKNVTDPQHWYFHLISRVMDTL
jgi:hypothetical protein